MYIVSSTFNCTITATTTSVLDAVTSPGIVFLEFSSCRIFLIVYHIVQRSNTLVYFIKILLTRIYSNNNRRSIHIFLLIPFHFFLYTAGEMAVFECTLLYTDSTTRVQWLKDNKPLEDRLADRLTASATGKTFRLTLQNVLESDSGIYIARAMNSEGQSTCTAQLIVQQRESIKFARELNYINHFFSPLSSYS